MKYYPLSGIHLSGGYTTQIWRTMKLTFIIITAFFMQVSASTLAQQVTFKANSISIKNVFTEIRKQTGYIVLYQAEELDASKTVSVNFDHASLKEAMTKILQNQELDFTIEDQSIVIKKKEPSLLEKLKNALTPSPPPSVVTGRIRNNIGEPLSGASITIKRTKEGTIAGADGKFILKNVDPNDTLLVSFIGYKTLIVPVNAKADFPYLIMEVATNGLDQVVVQAYGTTTQRLTTGDIGKVTAAEIERQPVMNPLLALQGKIAGLDVNQTSGYASAPVKVELRGRGNISNNFTSDPLYIIDGVPLTVVESGVSGNANLYKNGSAGFIQSGLLGPADGQSPLFSLNPSDIESIEVLKDADATAIYGSRGGQGVIIITTKKGKAGNTKVDLSFQEGITKVTRDYSLMNTQQYLAMRNEALRNDGIVPSVSNGDYDLLQWSQSNNTNWQKVLYGGTGRSTNAQVSLSGGNPQTSFRIGVGYNDNTGITTVSGSDQKASLSFNLTHSTPDHKFQVTLSGQYAFTQSDMTNLPSATLLPPNAPPIYDASGKLNWDAWGGDYTNARGALGQFGSLYNPYSSKTNFLNSNLNLNYEPLKGLNIGTNFGFNSAQANQTFFQTIAGQDPDSSPTGTSNYGYTMNKNWTIEPQVTYNIVVGKGKIDVLLGGELQQTRTDGFNFMGSGITNDILIQNVSAAPSSSINSMFEGEYKYAALFSRLSYNLGNKYLLNITTRRDGSSRFGSGNQYGNFGSLGAAWILSEENWFKKQLSFISFAKLKGSYGLTGSDAIGDYGYLTRLSTGIPYDGTVPLLPTQHANPNFHWSTTKKLEAGFDFGIFKDRVNFSVDYYRDRIGDQLVNFPIPNFTGFQNVIENSPALVQNSGWEFTGNAKIIDKKRITLTINFNGAFNYNKLVSYPNFALSPYYNTLIIGQPLNILKVWHLTGVDPQNGQYMVQDINHDGQISQADTYPLNLSPKFIGGFGINLTYQSFGLNLFFAIKQQTGQNALSQIANPGSIGNLPASMVGKEWQYPGDITTVAKYSSLFSASRTFYLASDGVYTDASFIRLENASLSYNLPAAYLAKIGMKSGSIFINANDLFTITKYQGPDPETQNFGGLPPTRTIVTGLKLSF
ncbi:MAG TPA: SusC/RagA family TonB-linked outer membrane protein [Mucilaginibacter sp.]|nr:SusC/RagA family TonB-linked outer membrane protein [Mucilaginibacter sp.]